MDLKAFNEIESKYDLLNRNVEGYFFWNYARTKIARCYEEKKSRVSSEEIQAENGIRYKISLRIKQLFNTVMKGKIPKKKCDVLVLNHSRRVLVDNFYECIYTDNIVEIIENALVLEEPYHNIHYQPAKTKNMIYTDIVELRSYLYCIWKNYFCSLWYKRNKQLMLQCIRKPIEELNAMYGVQIPAEQFANDMIYGLCMYKVEQKYYKKIIQKLQPKIILEVVSYSRRCMVVNELAEQRNIPTIELQHGTMGEEHTAYNYPKGYSIKQFPQYIFVFSDYWKNKARFPIAGKNVISVGYPYLDKMVEKYSDVKSDNKKKKNILFLSSVPIGERLAKEALGLRKQLDEDEYHIIYKLHPREYENYKDKYPDLKGAGIEIIDNNNTNLYQLFTSSDIQVSGYASTTIFEGLYFGLQTYILNYSVTKEIAMLCEEGIAIYFDSFVDLAEKIYKNRSRDIPKITYLWKSNGLQNMYQEILEIMKKHSTSHFYDDKD